MSYLSVLNGERRRPPKVEDVDDLLGALGLVTHRSGDERRGHCPSPAHAKRPGPGSWQIVAEGAKVGAHHCYACDFGGGPADLVAAVLGLTYDAAVEWLIDRYGHAIPERAISVVRWKVPPKRERELPLPSDAKPIEEVPGALAYLLGRGLTRGEILRWSMRAVPEGRYAYAGRVIVPVHVRRRVVDFVARRWVPGDPVTVPKALSGRRDDGARKELALWAYDALDPEVDVVHIVEGVWGALAAMRLGIPNVVASCGSAWSAERTELLAPWSKVVLIPDGDSAGSKFEQRISELRFGHEVLVVDLPHKAQPDTVGEALIEYVRAARPARFVSSVERPVVRTFVGKLRR